MKLKVILGMTLVALVAAAGSNTRAQGLEALAEFLRDNQSALMDYTWKSKVEFSLEGKPQSTTLYDVTFDDDGVMLRTPVSSDQSGKKPSKEEARTAQRLASVRSLTNSYIHMRPDAFGKQFAESIVSSVEEPDSGLTRVRAVSVVSPGDTMFVWYDPAAQRLHKIEINSTMQTQPVHLIAEFDELPDGTSYVARSTFESEELTKYQRRKRKPGKRMVIVTENYDHHRD